MALLIPSRKIIKTLLARKHEYGITRSYPSAIYRENITISWNNFFFLIKMSSTTHISITGLFVYFRDYGTAFNAGRALQWLLSETLHVFLHQDPLSCRSCSLPPQVTSFLPRTASQLRTPADSATLWNRCYRCRSSDLLGV